MSVLKVLCDISTLGIAGYSVHEEFVHVLINTMDLVLIYMFTLITSGKEWDFEEKGTSGLVPKSELGGKSTKMLAEDERFQGRRKIERR